VRGVHGDGAEPGVAEDEVVGAAGFAIEWVVGVWFAGDKLVPASAARWPPAEKPIITMRLGLIW